MGVFFSPEAISKVDDIKNHKQTQCFFPSSASLSSFCYPPFSTFCPFLGPKEALEVQWNQALGCSVVNNVVNNFFCFVLSPIVAVAKTQLFRQTLSKPGSESNILVISFNFRHTLTTSINLHATSAFFMLDNELQRIYPLASIITNIVQYLRNRHTFPKLTVTQIESNVTA